MGFGYSLDRLGRSRCCVCALEGFGGESDCYSHGRGFLLQVGAETSKLGEMSQRVCVAWRDNLIRPFTDLLAVMSGMSCPGRGKRAHREIGEVL